MISDAELIERVRQADPLIEVAKPDHAAWSKEQSLRQIEARLASAPTVSAGGTHRSNRYRWLAAAAVVLVAGALGVALSMTRSVDETVTTGGDGGDGSESTSSEVRASPSVGVRIERLATSALGDGHMRAATAAGPGIVAVGTDAVVWTSEDGSSWSRSKLDSGPISRERFDITLNDVVAGGPGLVAVGAIVQDPFFGVPETEMEARDRCLNGELEMCDTGWPEIETGVVVWTSPDGTTWDRTYSEVSVDGAVMHSVIAGGPGFVAVGSNAAGGEVWTSVDGVSWSPSADDGAVFAGHQILDVFSTQSELVAAGSAVWASEDGLEWRLVSEVEDPVYDQGDDRSGIRSVAVGSTGYVGVGFSGIWTSADGLDWVRVPDINDVIVNSHLDVVHGDGSGYVGFGQSSLGGPGAAFVSMDGLTWTEIPYEETVRPDDVVVIDGRVLVVGSGQSETGDLRPTVWEIVEVEQ